MNNPPIIAAVVGWRNNMIITCLKRTIISWSPHQWADSGSQHPDFTYLYILHLFTLEFYMVLIYIQIRLLLIFLNSLEWIVEFLEYLKMSQSGACYATVQIQNLVWFILRLCQHDYDLYRRSVTDYGLHRRTDTGSQRLVFPDGHPTKY